MALVSRFPLEQEPLKPSFPCVPFSSQTRNLQFRNRRQLLTPIKPDHKYLLTSERHVASFQIPNFDPNNSATLPSDALIVWTIDHATGKLSNAQRAPAGGMNPRQFSVNAKGDLAAVGLQDDGRVVILERKKDGSFGNILASVMIAGSPTSVIWDE